ncbi:hypothetical protein EON65_49815 [archaeon]|nr:MAG: hypothetical protein EON65_49815 [archaeon]
MLFFDLLIFMLLFFVTNLKQIAAVVIERKLGRPSNGMPASWRRPEAATSYNKKALRRLRSTLKNSASRVVGFVRVYVWPLLPLVLASSAVWFQRNSLRYIFSAAYTSLAKATWQREQQPSPAKTSPEKPKPNPFSLGKSTEKSKEKVDMKALNKVYSSSWMEEAGKAWWRWRK